MKSFQPSLPAGLLIACLGLLAGGVQAAENNARIAPLTFADMDQDGNGTVSRDEFISAHEKRLAARSSEIRPGAIGAAMKARFAALDSNGDGQLTVQELNAGQQRRMQEYLDRDPLSNTNATVRQSGFAAFDLNGDGKISREEFDEVRQKRMEERKRRGLPEPDPKRILTFEQIDSSADGVIEPAEFAAHQYHHYSRTPVQP